MGRSSETHTQVNPASRFYEFGGGDGKITYWNGEERVEVPFSEKKPFKFLVVEKGAQVVGGTEIDGTYEGYFSNFVKDTTKQPFTVRKKHGVVATGLWADIKDAVKAQGGKFATSLYIGVKNEDGALELQNIKFSGAALNAWIEATKKIDVFKGAFAITGTTKGKKGTVTYHMPEFKHIPEISEEVDEQAKELDRQFSQYLVTYFNNGTQERVMAAAANDVPVTEYSGVDPGEFWQNEPAPSEPVEDDVW